MRAKASERKILTARLEICDILTKNTATFDPCLKNLPEAKLKFGGNFVGRDFKLA